MIVANERRTQHDKEFQLQDYLREISELEDKLHKEKQRVLALKEHVDTL